MKRIPKAFTLGPHRIEVKIVSSEEMEKVASDAPWGLCDFANCIIYVQKVRKGFPRKTQIHAFWHEYFHMLLYMVGRERLSRDEVLVDQLGALQMQAFQTAEFTSASSSALE